MGDQAGSVRPLLARDRAVWSRPVRGLAILIFLLAALQTIRHDEAFLWLGVITAGALALVVPALEWRFGTDRLMASLPIRRATIVKARYVAAGLGIVLAWATWQLAGRLLAPALVPDRAGPDSWATLAGHLAFLALSAGVLAALLPLYFSLGLGRAAAAFFPVILALYLSALAIASATGVIDGGEGLARLAPPGALARAAAELLIGRAGSVGATAVVVLGAAALMAGSAALSVRGFRRRDI